MSILLTSGDSVESIAETMEAQWQSANSTQDFLVAASLRPKAQQAALWAGRRYGRICSWLTAAAIATRCAVSTRTKERSRADSGFGGGFLWRLPRLRLGDGRHEEERNGM